MLSPPLKLSSLGPSSGGADGGQQQEMAPRPSYKDRSKERLGRRKHRLHSALRHRTLTKRTERRSVQASRHHCMGRAMPTDGCARSRLQEHRAGQAAVPPTHTACGPRKRSKAGNWELHITDACGPKGPIEVIVDSVPLHQDKPVLKLSQEATILSEGS
ncbi:hypothetical protein CB1_000668006 [Camelus ferus]|nr:hypothetical protein CB1_000668006 [Camelus ferus]